MKIHTKKEILKLLNDQSIGILGTMEQREQQIRLRVMYCGIDQKFNCYLMSTKGSPKVEQILTTSIISFMVFGLEDPYDQSWEIEMNGKARLLTIPREIETALNQLKGRNPFADVCIESGITSQFEYIYLKPSVIRFRIYNEALMNQPPTIITL